MREGERDDFSHVERLHIAVHFKTQDCLRTPEIPALQYAPILQFQSVGGRYGNNEQTQGGCGNKTHETLHCDSPLDIFTRQTLGDALQLSIRLPKPEWSISQSLFYPHLMSENPPRMYLLCGCVNGAGEVSHECGTILHFYQATK